MNMEPFCEARLRSNCPGPPSAVVGGKSLCKFHAADAIACAEWFSAIRYSEGPFGGNEEVASSDLSTQRISQ